MYLRKPTLKEAGVPDNEHALLKFLEQFRDDPDTPSDEEMEIWAASDKDKSKIIARVRRKYQDIIENMPEETDPRIMLGLSKRHRYGDDIDILRSTFTKTIDEINDETFQLLQQTRVLHHAVMKLNESIPKVTKYRYGTLLENAVHSLLADCFRIQRKYYRRNMLESMHIELDILRSYFYECSVDYPEWMTTKQLYIMNELANKVSCIIGGLLKCTVA